MKRNRSLCVVLLFSTMVLGLSIADTSETYEIHENILYQDDTDAPLTDAIKEACRLDLYCPVNATGFPTVVWFHGGGLTGGTRSIPEMLKNQQMAVATVDYRLMKVAGHEKTELYEVQGFNHGNMPQGAFPLLIDHVKAWTKAHKAVAVLPQERYLEPLFSDVDRQDDILFRTTPDHTGHPIELTLDVYGPRGDTVKNRPAILWIHGGGFRPGNDKQQKYIVHMAMTQ